LRFAAALVGMAVLSVTILWPFYAFRYAARPSGLKMSPTLAEFAGRLQRPARGNWTGKSISTKALAEAQAAEKLAPRIAMMHVCLGDALWEVNRHDEARQEYRDAITMAQTVEPEFQKRLDSVCPGASGEQVTSYLQPVPRNCSRAVASGYS
jgi:hypothetical protein